MATITEIQATDVVKDSRAVINTNFSNLNTDLTKVVTQASASAPASLDLHEDTDNGTNKITVTAPSAVASDKVLTLPDATDTLIGKDTTDTLTNKTLTSPTINTPTLVLANTTPTADGGIGFDRTNENLVVGDGLAGQSVHMGAWISFTPSWTNLTVGAGGTNTGYYTVIGKTVIGYTYFKFGTGSAVGTNPTLTFPVTISSRYGSNQSVGNIEIRDNNVPSMFLAYITSGGIAFSWAVNGSNVSRASITATAPMTWATDDELLISFTYEAA